MIEGWLENDPDAISKQIGQRLALEARNEELNKRHSTMPAPLLFDSHGGMRIVPQENYSPLSAIFHGLHQREERGYDAWLDILERHAAKAEDPHVWSFLLADKGRWLFWADRSRVQRLLCTLSERDFGIFMNSDLLHLLWNARAMFPPALMLRICEAWLASEDERLRQGASELVQAFLLIDPDGEIGTKLASRLKDAVSPELTGRLFSGAAAWRVDEQPLRRRAHEFLMKHVAEATGDQAHAISTAVDRTDHLSPDDLTRELILAIATNPDVLAASLTGRFADGLQSLLLYPGFDEPVLHVTEQIANLIIDQKGGPHRGFLDKDFVQVAIALQRNDGPLRARAMDLYEKLLDANAYGAEEAAKAAMGR
jgi:hypothetical protein